MKSRFFILAVSLALAGCATPTTTLQHPKSKQIVSCGGGMAGSVAGGMIGYSIQQDNDAECVKNYEDVGFKVLQTKTSSMK